MVIEHSMFINEFPELMNPHTRSESLVVEENSSAWPTHIYYAGCSREAESIYTGITIAEYFRILGYS